MTNRLTDLWNAEENNAMFSDPTGLANRLTDFERRVRLSNVLEFVAGGIVLALFGSGAVGAFVAGQWPLALSLTLIVLGTLFVITFLYRHGAGASRLPEESCADHLRAQLQHRRDLLRSVPKWYLAPLLPGVLGIYGTVIAANVARKGLFPAIFDMSVLLLFATLAFFAFVAWLNLRGARKLDAEIAALNQI